MKFQTELKLKENECLKGESTVGYDDGLCVNTIQVVRKNAYDVVYVKLIAAWESRTPAFPDIMDLSEQIPVHDEKGNTIGFTESLLAKNPFKGASQ